MTEASEVFVESRRSEVLRWALCAALVIAIHGGAAFAYLSQADEEGFGDGGGAPIQVITLTDPEAPVSDEAPGKQDQVEQEQQEEIKEEKPEERAVEVPMIEPAEVVLPQEEVREEQKKPQQAQEQSAAETRATQALNDAEAKSWHMMLGRHLQRFKRYPYEAARRGAPRGVTHVEFTINADGKVVSSKVVKSSGNVHLDAGALDMLQRANPMPRPPPGAMLVYTFPVRFTSADR